MFYVKNHVDLIKYQPILHGLSWGSPKRDDYITSHGSAPHSTCLFRCIVEVSATQEFKWRSHEMISNTNQTYANLQSRLTSLSTMESLGKRNGVVNHSAAPGLAPMTANMRFQCIRGHYHEKLCCPSAGTHERPNSQAFKSSQIVTGARHKSQPEEKCQHRLAHGANLEPKLCKVQGPLTWHGTASVC